MLNEIFRLVGIIGSSVAIALALFQFIGKRWLEHQFAKRLEAYKHAQAQELEQLRLKINSLFNRVTKIHEKEFEVLPLAWEKLQIALGSVSAVTSPSPAKSDHGLDRMSDPRLQEWLRKSGLEEYEKKELLHSPDRNKYYREARFWHDVNKAASEANDFHNYVIINKIFLSVDLHKLFTDVDRTLQEALIECQMAKETDDLKLAMQAWQKVSKGIDPILKQIESIVQKRLHYQEA